MGCLRGCLGSAVSIALLGAVAYGGWRWGEPVFSRAEDWFGVESRANIESALESEGIDRSEVDIAQTSSGPEGMNLLTEDLGRAALDRIDALDAAGAEAELSGPEVASILRFILQELIPEGVTQPTVNFDGGMIRSSARVSGALLGDLPDLIERTGVLDETVRIRLDGTLVPYRDGAVTFMVDRLEIGGVPVPGPLVPRTLDALGRDRANDLPDDGILAALPAGLRSAWVRGETLVVVAGG